LTLPMGRGASLTLPASALPPHLLKPGTRLTLPVGGRNIPLVPLRPKTSSVVSTRCCPTSFVEDSLSELCTDLRIGESRSVHT
jgi:hypothetical protein